MELDKAIELNIESEQSLRKHKFPDHADGILLAIEALRAIKKVRTTLRPYVEALLPGEDSIEDRGPSAERIKRLKESPIGRK